MTWKRLGFYRQKPDLCQLVYITSVSYTHLDVYKRQAVAFGHPRQCVQSGRHRKLGAFERKVPGSPGERARVGGTAPGQFNGDVIQAGIFRCSEPLALGARFALNKVTQNAVSYTHLDVYKRQPMHDPVGPQIRAPQAE